MQKQHSPYWDGAAPEVKAGPGRMLARMLKLFSGASMVIIIAMNRDRLVRFVDKMTVVKERGFLHCSLRRTNIYIVEAKLNSKLQQA